MTLEWNKVNLIDCIEGLSQLDDNSVDCFIIDPPYNIGKDFGNNKSNKKIQEYVNWCESWILQCERALKPSGTMYIYGFSEVLAHVSCKINLPYRWLVWHYTNKTVPSSNFWQRSHESILCVWKQKDERFFNRDAVREPYTDKFVRGFSGKKRKRPGSKGRFGTTETTYKVNEKGALPRDVIKLSSLAGGRGAERFVYSPSKKDIFTRKRAKELLSTEDQITHPTQKPIKLTEKLLDACISDTNSKVVIPFSGTGSEAFVCNTRGYDWISFEINEHYVEMGSLLIEKGFPTDGEKT